MGVGLGIAARHLDHSAAPLKKGEIAAGPARLATAVRIWNVRFIKYFHGAIGKICHEFCRSTTLGVTNVVEKKTSARDNCGEDESYRSVNALNQGLALSRSQGILLSVPSAVTYSLPEHHLISIERIGLLEAKTIHTPELLMSVSGKTILTTI